MKDQSFDEHSAKSSNSDLGAVRPNAFHEPFQEPCFKPHFRFQMFFHVLSMVRCPVSCALPLALFHRIAGDHVDPDAINVEFQIGVFCISIDRFSMDSFPNRWEDFLGPLLPLHCWREGGEDVQVGFAAQPSVPGVGSLNRDSSSEPRVVQNVLNMIFQRLSQLGHSCSFVVAWNDFLCNLVQDRLDRGRHQGTASEQLVFETGLVIAYRDWAGISSKVEYFGPELERMLCLSRTLSTVNEPKLSSFRCWRKLAISSLFLPDRTRAIVMWGPKGRSSLLQPRGESSLSTSSSIRSTSPHPSSPPT